ncbi:MAG: hypothetical protein AAGA90_20265 [Actinomycetota bacterium]
MPMRQDCKYFESRSYANGDTVRKCDLDLAPEAPWRCPADCPKYTRRMADVNWSYGTLVTPATPDEPESLGEDDSIAALLDAAEDIINAAVPGTVSDLEEERRKRDSKGLKRFKRNKGGADAGPGGSYRQPPAAPPKGSGKKGKKPKKQKGDGLGERFRRRYREGR